MIGRGAAILAAGHLVLATAGAAGATAITGSYAVSTAGSAGPAIYETDEPTTMQWSLSQPGARHASGSALPATLVTVARTPYLVPCGDDPAGPAATTTLAIGSPAASFTFAMTVDAVHGRGTVMLAPSSTSGKVVQSFVGCPDPDGPATTSKTTFPAASVLIPGPAYTSSTWAIRRSSSTLWTLDTTRVVPAGSPGLGPATIVVSLRLAGALPSLRSFCTVPTPKTLGRLQAAAGRAYLKRAGFRVARTSTAYKVGVGKGHVFLSEFSKTLACGTKLELLVSLGRPPRGSGGGGGGGIGVGAGRLAHQTTRGVA
jgi:hypothetical protein